MRPVEEVDEEASILLEDGYTLINKPNNVGYYLLAKVDLQSGGVHLVELSPLKEIPKVIVMDRRGLDIINGLFQ